MPSSLSTAKYAQGGELYARMRLADDLSEDSMAGRLILQSSNVAWVADGKRERPEKVGHFPDGTTWFIHHIQPLI